MSGKTCVRKTQVQIVCSIWFVRLCIEKRVNELVINV